MKAHNPETIAAPMSQYSHGIEVPPDARWLVVSGQVGVAPDGTTPEDALEQNRQAWSNIVAILGAAGMGPSDLVRINGDITEEDGVAAFRQARDEVIGDHAPASTLIRVAGLAAPAWKVEIEVIAARA